MPGSTGRIARRVWYILLSLIALSVIFGALIATAGVSPTFCGLCHSPEVDAMAATGHGEVRCDTCHSTSTTFGLMADRISLVSMVYTKLLFGGGTARTYVQDEPCLSCHADTLRQASTSNGIRMDHTGLDSAEWPCTRCHPTAAHGPASYRQKGYDMDMCVPCHNTNPDNPETCKTCHPDGAPTDTSGDVGASDLPSPWEVTHGENAQVTHGMGDLTTCDSCHDPAYCESCHGLVLPHPADYLKTHGAQAIDFGPDSCQTCHTAAFCDDCHSGVEMPHPPGFSPGHPEEAAASPEACVGCHKQETCDECHERSTHPGLTPDVRDALQGHPVG